MIAYGGTALAVVSARKATRHDGPFSCAATYCGGVDALGLRATIYRHFADTGRAATAASLNTIVGDPALTTVQLRRLHDNHMIVLDSADEIIMALPFSARPTGHTVTSGDRSWWANCAWDSLAIVAALDVNAQIRATWLDTEEPVEFTITDGALDSTDGFIHFAIPARHWWDDIVRT